MKKIEHETSLAPIIQYWVLISVALLSALFNLFGYVQIYRSTKSLFKFEQIVLLNGILISLLVKFAVFSEYMILVQTIHFVDLLILIFITKRIMSVYFISNGDEDISERFYILFTAINIGIFIAVTTTNILMLLVNMNVVALNNHALYLSVICEIYGQKLFGLVVSIICVFWGIRLIRSMEANDEDCFNNALDGSLSFSRRKDIDFSVSGLNTIYDSSFQKLRKSKEVFTRSRILQIALIIWSELTIYISEFFLLLGVDIWAISTSSDGKTLFSLETHFEFSDSIHSWIYFSYLLILLFPVIFNFLAMYYVVRYSYKIQIKSRKLSKKTRAKNLNNTNSVIIITQEEFIQSSLPKVDADTGIQGFSKRLSNADDFLDDF